MSDLPLSSFTIINTRPIKQAAPLNVLLQSLGSHTISLPMLTIAPITSMAVKRTCQQLHHIDVAIFVSANGVHCSQPFWPNPFPVTTVVAIGPGTATALQQYGITEVVLPVQYHSEGLLALATLSAVKTKKIALFCGENSRPLLKKTLIERGADIICCECYQRQYPTIDDVVIASLQQHPADAIISTSQQGLANLNQFSKQYPPLKAIPIVVISPNMANIAKQQAWQHIIVAPNASNQAIIDTLKKLKR